MEEKHQHSHPQLPEKITDLPAGKKVSLPILIVIAIVIAFLVSVTIFLLTKKTSPSNLPQISTNPPITSVPKPVEWKTYTNTETGFSLKYPDTVLFESELKGATKPVLLVSVEKLSNIAQDMPLRMGRTDALKEKADLEKGGGETVVKIGSLYGNLGMTLSQFEVCSVILTRSLTFYPGDYRVIISLVGPKKAIMDSMPEFFTVDKANCGTQTVWNRSNPKNFEETLAKKQGAGMAQEWYNTFDEIVKTITLTVPAITTVAPTKTVSSDWLTYKNMQYGFEISYPPSYKALDSKNDLYGYPNGAALIYSGGQAYDVVIEVWNTESEYKEKYATMMSDVTVLKSNGKFITLLNSTHQPKNDQIIASFKQ